jgi:hypothetical protein
MHASFSSSQNGNHVELAMEWLIVNPEAAAAAEAAATAGGAAAQHQVDDQALAQMVAATLSVGGAKPGAQQEGVEEVPTATMPDTPALVDSAGQKAPCTGVLLVLRHRAQRWGRAADVELLWLLKHTSLKRQHSLV